MKINVTIKTIYGKKTYYPDCDISRKLAGLMDQLTFTQANIDTIKSMGIEVVNSTPIEQI